MLTEKQINKLLGVVSLYREDAAKMLDVRVEDAETQEEYEQWTEMEMTLEAMKTADWSSDIEVLRQENAALKKILQGVAGNLRAVADQVSEIGREEKI
ncbi:MAG: hypothetical protein Q4A78_13255 [Peptostreptococcaceae bacterium]|nr:hypothetical protein [Peptostreptococcaceae bacterium]